MACHFDVSDIGFVTVTMTCVWQRAYETL